MSFSQILGQTRAKKFLKQVILREKIPHAYLFTGIQGIGKTSMAMAFAMVLNCHEPTSSDACMECSSCRQMMNGNFPDFMTIRPEDRNIKINQIRELNRSLGFAPMSSMYRVCVIYQAESMTVEAANSLLKILEEPPPGNILILNATEPLDLLPTIVSRCQRVPFQPLPVEKMSLWLTENRGLDSETATILSKISFGSLGRALGMCEGDFLDKRRKWLLRLIELPGMSRDQALETALECAKENTKTARNNSDSKEDNLMGMLAIWESWYRDLLLMRAGGPSLKLMNADFSGKLKKIAEDFTTDGLISDLFAINRAQRDLLRMRNTTLVMEQMILTLN